MEDGPVSKSTSIAQDLLRVAIDALRTFEFIDDNEYKAGAQGLAMREEMMPCMCSYDPGKSFTLMSFSLFNFARLSLFCDLSSSSFSFVIYLLGVSFL
jgi:hypothetical protein